MNPIRKTLTPTSLSEASPLMNIFNIFMKGQAWETACIETDPMQRDFERYNFAKNLCETSHFSGDVKYSLFKTVSSLVFNPKPFVPAPTIDYLSDSDFKIGKLSMYFGGTGRSALDSLGITNVIDKSMLFRISENVYASLYFDCLMNKKMGLNLYVDGVGYSEPEMGIHGHNNSSVGFLKFLKDKYINAQAFNSGPGNIDDNVQYMSEAIEMVKGNFDDELEIFGDAYSRGSVSLALMDVAKYAPKNVTFKLRDPVAGAFDQTSIGVTGVDHLIVQYSMENAIPGFWATPVYTKSAKNIAYVFTIGGHSSLAREDTNRLGDLANLANGVHIEHRPGYLMQLEVEKAIELFEALQENANSGIETGTVMNRFGEMKLALKGSSEAIQRATKN